MTEGAAELSLVGGGMLGASVLWPVLGDNVRLGVDIVALVGRKVHVLQVVLVGDELCST